MATVQKLSSRKASGNIGCIVDGADLTAPLSAEHRDFIGRNLYEHGVVFFRGPQLTSE